MKKLICTEAVEALAKKGEKEIYLDSNTIVTPAARDAAEAHGVRFCDKPQCCGDSGAGGQSGDPLSSDMIYNAMKAMAAQGMFKGMFDETSGGSGCVAPVMPYQAEYDPSGFKVVRGNSVKMDVFETGVPADDGKVMYQELIGSGDKSSMNAGFMTINSCTFDWDVQCEEIYYVVSGAITVTIDGKPYTARQGDSLFIRNGSKVVFSADGMVKVFYATY